MERTPRRKRGLTAERVVQAAVELADAGGLDAVSMSRVAERLGFTTMSLYRHVSGKDELLARMVDAAVGPPPGESPRGWRQGLERWSWDLLATARRHPWLLRVALARVPFGPNRLAWFDRALGCLAGTALTEDEKAAVVLLANEYTFSQARIAADIGESADGGVAELWPIEVDPDRFPALHRAVEAGIFDPSGGDPDADFAFGLERVLDGVEALVTKRAG